MLQYATGVQYENLCIKYLFSVIVGTVKYDQSGEKTKLLNYSTYPVCQH